LTLLPGKISCNFLNFRGQLTSFDVEFVDLLFKLKLRILLDLVKSVFGLLQVFLESINLLLLESIVMIDSCYNVC